ncbi:PREDICTED: LOW QUALITY PROTEIN: uncharacterized protein C6orf10-like [Odobenus rosmarus divergens]|uniref:LOW QUALITY PROTEIN: uncharacterized protein C6orf10-like n=1 Tax=Odobenus rosmarus divergens TaxID=9708 RepID=A0A9B0LZU5_ODORO
MRGFVDDDYKVFPNDKQFMPSAVVFINMTTFSQGPLKVLIAHPCFVAEITLAVILTLLGLAILAILLTRWTRRKQNEIDVSRYSSEQSAGLLDYEDGRDVPSQRSKRGRGFRHLYSTESDTSYDEQEAMLSVGFDEALTEGSDRVGKSTRQEEPTHVAVPIITPVPVVIGPVAAVDSSGKITLSPMVIFPGYMDAELAKKTDFKAKILKNGATIKSESSQEENKKTLKKEIIDSDESLTSRQPESKSKAKSTELEKGRIGMEVKETESDTRILKEEDQVKVSDLGIPQEQEAQVEMNDTGIPQEQEDQVKKTESGIPQGQGSQVKKSESGIRQGQGSQVKKSESGIKQGQGSQVKKSESGIKQGQGSQVKKSESGIRQGQGSQVKSDTRIPEGQESQVENSEAGIPQRQESQVENSEAGIPQGQKSPVDNSESELPQVQGTRVKRESSEDQGKQGDARKKTDTEENDAMKKSDEGKHEVKGKKKSELKSKKKSSVRAKTSKGRKYNKKMERVRANKMQAHKSTDYYDSHPPVTSHNTVIA